MTRATRAATVTALFVTLGALAGCATAPKPMSITEIREISATVTALDLAERAMTIKGPAGNEFTVEVDPAVQNLAQVKVGDKVVARYYESIGADLRQAGDSTSPKIELTDAVAAAGQRPAAMAGERMTIPVTIVAVDKDAHVVRFYGADRRVRELAVQTPEAKAYIRKLRGGDEVIVTFTEALAISVEPAK
jgi:hypothetical protein